MAEKTKIEWTDHTFNPWRGCMKVHAGCAHCYAESQSKRNPGMLGVWGDSGTRVVGSEEMWSQPGKWNKAAEKSGERRRVFCASMADVFEDWAGPLTNANGHVLFPGNCLTNPWRDSGNPETEKPLTLNDVRRRLFALIDETPWLDWQLLTKRPENVRRMWPSFTLLPPNVRVEHALNHPHADIPDSTSPSPRRPNVWIGTSISDQATADKYVPELLKLRDLSPLLFVSAEPLLGPVRLDQVQCEGLVEIDALRGRHGLKRPLQGKSPAVDWVIGGGESGPKARPCDVAWIRSVVQQCRDSDVPVFVKQMGAVSYEKTLDDIGEWKYAAFPLEDHKGGDPDEWPEDLRVREFPALIGGAE